MNYYELLNVSKDASQEEIKKSYRKLVKQYHPDKGGDEAMFKKITEAYENLNDSNKRQSYDNTLKFGGSRGGWEQVFQQFNGNFSDIFNDAFNHSAKGQDVTVRINLTMLEVYYGTSRNIETGTESFNINIPKGIKDGAKLRIKERGRPHPINSSAQKGDVIVIVHILPDTNMIVNENDIWVDYSLPFYDLLLGGKFELKTPVNTITFSVPENSYDGKMLRISGKGMPIYNTNEYGNLMVKLRTSDVKLNEEQLSLVKKIKDLHNA